MRRLLLTLMTCVLASLAGAQVILHYGDSIDYGIGLRGEIITPYVTFPASTVQPYAGCTLTRVRIGLCEEATGVTVYVKHDARDNRPERSQKVAGTLSPGWNEVVLDEPYVIPADGNLTLGYKATFAQAQGAGCSRENHPEAQTVYQNSRSSWTTIGEGSFCIEGVIEGNLPVDELAMGSVASQQAPYHAATKAFGGTVRNVGANRVTDFTIRWTMDDGEPQEQAFTADLATNATATWSIDVPATVTGVHSLTFSIGDVNGHPDAYAGNNTATARLTVLDPLWMRRAVCEEHTGFWCGWCPRGMVGMELMKEAHPDQFIAITIHSDDALQIPLELPYSYAPFLAAQTGAPYCTVDRRLSGDPYGDIARLWATETATDAQAVIEVRAAWNADSTAITATSAVRVRTALSTEALRVAYVLTEDSVRSDDYAQHNYYAGGGNGALYGWEKKTDPTSDVWFNDLARGIWPSYHGQPIDADVVDGTELPDEAFGSVLTFDVPATVQHRDQLHVVALLIDASSGYLLNAAITSVNQDSSASSVARVSSVDSPTDTWYSLTGQRLAEPPTRGIAIGRCVMPDGTVRIRRICRP